MGNDVSKGLVVGVSTAADFWVFLGWGIWRGWINGIKGRTRENNVRVRWYSYWHAGW